MAAPSLLTRLALRSRSTLARSPEQPQPSVQGVTLVECLVAIAVIALTTAMVTPPLFLAAATRMQNQRAEQALHLAQGEIDRIRTLVERSAHVQNKLPAYQSGVQDAALPNTVAPTGLFNRLKSFSGTCPAASAYNDEQIPVSLALPVDTSGDCVPDFMVQMFRTAGTTPASENLATGGQGRPGQFYVGVRVYGRPAITYLQQGGRLETNPVSLQFTSGDGNQKTRPLAVLFTRINWSDQRFSLCQFQTGNAQSNCPP